jgi:hypothetical protein
MVLQFFEDIKQYALKIINRNKNKDIPVNYTFNEIPILVFNSAIFDMNLLVKNLYIDDYKIESTLGKSIFYKYLKVSTSVYKNSKPKKDIL